MELNQAMLLRRSQRVARVASGYRAAEPTIEGQIESPVGAILVLVVATLICVVSVPEEVGPVGALRFPATVMAIGYLVAPIWYSRHDFRLFFQPAFILAVAPVFWLLLDMIQGAYPMWGFARADIQKTFITISLFSICAWMTAYRPRYWFIRKIPWVVFRQFSPQFYFAIGIVAFGLAFLRFAIPSGFDPAVMYNALLEDRWSAPWSRGALGGWDAFLDHLSYFGYILPVLTVVLAKRLGWMAPRTIILAVCSVAITLLLAQGGGRRILGVLLGSAAVYWFLTVEHPRALAVISLCGVLCAIGIAMNVMLEIRATGLKVQEDVDQRPFENPDAEEEGAVFIHVDDNFLRLTQMNYIFPRFLPYLPLPYIEYNLVRPIPRVFWSGKPISPGFDLAAATGQEGTSLTYTVVGELVMCGGYVGICVGGMLYGLIAASITPLRSRRLGDSGLLLYSCGLLMIFAGFRSLTELILMSYMLLAYIALSVLYQHISVAGR